MLSLKKHKLETTEKQTFKLHVIYSILEGVVLGIIALNEFVFIKSLNGSNIQLSFLFQFSMIVFLLLLVFNETLKRIQDKKKLLRITAIITRIPLLLLFFFPHTHQAVANQPIYHLLFLAIFLIYYLASPITYPIINLFLKNAYQHENFGPLYGYATVINKIVLLVVTFAYGLWLDYDNFAFTYSLPLVAILGIISVFVLSKIDYENITIVDEKKTTFMQSIGHSIKSMRDTTKFNKPYRDFEIGFMFYGFSFMSTVSVITIFFDKALHLNYSSVAFYKNAYNILAIILLPYFSRLIGKIDPRKFAMITFGSVCLYLLCLVATDYLRWNITILGIQVYYMLIIYVLFHSVFAATMSLLWSIGSAYFCKSAEADVYQSTHLYLTSVRAIFSPILGVLLYQMFGFSVTFVIAAISLFIGVIYMYYSYKKTGDLKTYD